MDYVADTESADEGNALFSGLFVGTVDRGPLIVQRKRQAEPDLN